MSRIFLGLFLHWALASADAFALERSFAEGYLGEKNAAAYAGPWHPIFHHDSYFGRYTWDDEPFSNGYFYPYIWPGAGEWGRFFSEEINGASTCSHSALSKNFDEIRYGFRLISLSYLLEVMDGARADMDLLKKTNACRFDLRSLIKACRPKSKDMRTFLENLSMQEPYSAPIVGKDHNYATFEREWLASVSKGDGSMAAVRASIQCQIEKRSCHSLSSSTASEVMERACQEDRALFNEICSEEDQIYGISRSPMASFLVGSSNLVPLFNEEGQAVGCLRRFSQMMSHKERARPGLSGMLTAVHASLKSKYGERFPHGRAFIYGALKEFERKGLTRVFEPKVEKPVERPVVVDAPKPEAKPIELPKPVEPTVVVAPVPKIEKKTEVPVEDKSAFFQAAEVRQSQNLERVDVDMLKFSYDYVFSRAEMQLLQISLKDFTERKTLEEMKSFDKLGTPEAAVPLTFIKFLIDAQNHQGLYNLVAVLSDKFWISNDVDARYKPGPEFCELRNDASTGNAWQIYIRRPDE